MEELSRKEQGNRFRVRSIGLRAPDLNRDDVITKVAAQFKINKQRALAVLKGRVVASDISEQKARALKSRLLQLGVMAKVEKTDAAIPTSQTAKPNLDLFFSGLKRASSHVARDARYHAMAVLMLMGSILLPLLYLATVIGLLVGTWVYIVDVPLVRSSFGGLVLWLCPIFVALVVAIFLIRPILTRQAKLTRIEINESQAPRLFKLVRHISDLTNTPMPISIYVTCETNAYVSSSSGTLGYLQKKLELTIGMPLVYGLNTLQLASVLAHEFGHFSQTFEMFTSGLVNQVNSWLGRCGFYKDPLEIKLEKYCAEADHDLAALPAQVALWCLAGISWLFRKLYDLNLRATQGLSQQMEFNADDHAVQIIGSRAFTSSSVRLRELGYAEQLAWQANRGAYNENQLFNNLPDAYQQFSTMLDDTAKAEIDAELENGTTEYWSSHPADRERIDRALAQNIDNVPHGTASAIALFEDPDKLSCQLTLQTYTRDHGLSDASKCAVANQVIYDTHKHQGEGQEALLKLFGDAYQGQVLQFTDKVEAQQQLPAAPGVLAKIRADKCQHLDNLILSSIYAEAGIVFEPGTWDIDDHASQALEYEINSTIKQLRTAEQKVLKVDQYFQAEINQTLRGSANNTRAQDLYKWCIHIAPLSDDLDHLLRYVKILNSLLSVLEEREIRLLETSLVDHQKHTVELVNRTVARMKKLINPLTEKATDQQTSVANFLSTWGVSELQSGDTPSHIQEVALNTRNGILFLYQRALGELAQSVVVAKRQESPRKPARRAAAKPTRHPAQVAQNGATG